MIAFTLARRKNDSLGVGDRVRSSPRPFAVVARKPLSARSATAYATTMFVRFRQQGHRLQASLMQTRREAGAIKSEHVASLGSVGLDVTIRDRLDFWKYVEPRLDRLANRIGPDERAKIIDALDARIPVLTDDDLRSVQEDNAKHDQKFWGDVRDTNADVAARHRSIIARAEEEIANVMSTAEEVAERIDVATDRVARIERGEPVVGGLGKKLDVLKIMKEAGMTQSDVNHAMRVASLTEEEFASVTPLLMKTISKADRAAVRRILRQRQR